MWDGLLPAAGIGDIGPLLDFGVASRGEAVDPTDQTDSGVSLSLEFPMKISSVESFKIEIPLSEEQQQRPCYHTSGVTRIRTTEGITGYGETFMDSGWNYGGVVHSNVINRASDIVPLIGN